MAESCFPNLAGRDGCDPIVEAELASAGIDPVHLPVVLPTGEVPTRFVGQLGPWSFRRAWRYWVAEGPGLPPDRAEGLHLRHGRSCRVAGHCGCPSPREWYKGFGVPLYHVDTAESLKALATEIAAVMA